MFVFPGVGWGIGLAPSFAVKMYGLARRFYGPIDFSPNGFTSTTLEVIDSCCLIIMDAMPMTTIWKEDPQQPFTQGETVPISIYITHGTNKSFGLCLYHPASFFLTYVGGNSSLQYRGLNRSVYAIAKVLLRDPPPVLSVVEGSWIYRTISDIKELYSAAFEELATAALWIVKGHGHTQLEARRMMGAMLTNSIHGSPCWRGNNEISFDFDDLENLQLYAFSEC